MAELERLQLPSLNGSVGFFRAFLMPLGTRPAVSPGRNSFAVHALGDPRTAGPAQPGGLLSGTRRHSSAPTWPRLTRGFVPRLRPGPHADVAGPPCTFSESSAVSLPVQTTRLRSSYGRGIDVVGPCELAALVPVPYRMEHAVGFVGDYARQQWEAGSGCAFAWWTVPIGCWPVVVLLK